MAVQAQKLGLRSRGADQAINRSAEDLEAEEPSRSKRLGSNRAEG